MVMRRVLVCGDREWTNGRLIREKLEAILIAEGIEVLIEGEARGADKLSAYAALSLGIPEGRIMRFPADWTKYKKAAGPIRNRKQLKEGAPDLGLAFHNDLANSIGTKDMVRLLLKAGIETHVYTERGEVNVRAK
jgi:hypothetical protein